MTRSDLLNLLSLPFDTIMCVGRLFTTITEPGTNVVLVLDSQTLEEWLDSVHPMDCTLALALQQDGLLIEAV